MKTATMWFEHMFGLGLIDITQVNAVDAYTNLPLDNSAKLRIYGGGWVEVVRTTFYVGDRARFFYVAGANCDRLCTTSTCNGDIDITYEIEFTNGFNWYSKHCSADEIGVLETSIAFLVLYVLLGACYFLTRKELKKLRKHHHTVKMLCSRDHHSRFLLADGFFFLHYIWTERESRERESSCSWRGSCSSRARPRSSCCSSSSPRGGPSAASHELAVSSA